MLYRGTIIVAAMMFSVQIAVQAGEIKQQDGQDVWVSHACDPPLAPSVNRDDAQALNASVNRFNRYVADVDAYNRCLSEEAGVDSEALVAVINGSVRDLQNEAIAGVEVERSALARKEP